MQQPTGAGQSQTQMKMMMYGMPIVFFFVLYDAPSGLLVYWIASNVLTTVQQVIINRIIHKHRAEVLAESAAHEKVLAGKGPKGIKKGRK
jgi:YidC/Oxa1 family membrane protein insertase